MTCLLSNHKIPISDAQENVLDTKREVWKIYGSVWMGVKLMLQLEVWFGTYSLSNYLSVTSNKADRKLCLIYSQVSRIFERIRKGMADRPYLSHVVQPYYAVENKFGAEDNEVYEFKFNTSV